MPGSEPGLDHAIPAAQPTEVAASAGLSSLLQKPHHAAEVSAWLSKRATMSEVQRFDRLMSLVQQQIEPRQRPASSLGFSTPQHSGASRQQRHDSTSSTATAGPRAASARPAAPAASWHHTATTQAAAAAAAAAAVPSKGLASCKPASGSEASSSSKPGIIASPPSPAAAPAAPASASMLSITTAQAFHGLKDLYPDLWAATTPICRPAPAPNRNFTSAWGDALRQGADKSWSPFLASSYQAANATVAKPTDEFAVRADNALLAWAAKQKLYSQELLTPQAAAAVAALLGEAKEPPASAAGSRGTTGATAGSDGAAAAEGGASSRLTLDGKKELLELLRQLAAVVEPESERSMSHSCHKRQHSVDQPEATALLKEQTRIKTMGFPRKVAVKGLRTHHRPAATAATGQQASCGSNSSGQPAAALSCAVSDAVGGVAASAGPSGSGKASTAANAREETLMSSVPLKWAAAAVGTPTTSYTAAFGGHPGRSPQMCKTVFREVNVGFGSVDTLLHPPGSALFPVQQLFLQLVPLVPGQQPQQQQADQQATTQRRSYQSRDAVSVAASVAAARERTEASRAARNQSFIPLGRGGLQLGSSAQWLSSYGAGFVPRQADLSANKAMAAAVAGMFNGPTIAFGKIAGMRPADAAGIKKFQLQQQEEAAARAAAEAELDSRAAGGRATG